MDKVALVVRILLGVIFLVFGLNGFLNFLDPGLEGPALDFMMTLIQIKLLTVVKTIEVLVGLAFLTNFYSRLATFLIAPIAFNIFWFHLMLEPKGLPIGIFLVLAVGFLLYHNRSVLEPILVAKPRK